MANNKRSGKFYRKNEQEVMRSLGFSPTPNSGSGWVIKEDGINEDAICQLKSTDATSIKISQKDIEVLEYNALVSHKIPVFAIQFLNTDEIFLVIRPELLVDTLRVVKGERPRDNQSDFLGLETREIEAQRGVHKNGLKPKKDLESENPKKVIKSSANSRKSFMEENDSRYKRKSKPAR